MATGQLQNVLKHLRKILARRRESGASDGELLERFSVSQDEEAFELLLWRHHRMVLGVCSRILADSNDVEDAFQATFLILARKGRSIRKRGSLSSWLYGVARRVALEVHRGTKRLQPSRLPPPPSCPEPGDELMRQELCGIFDEELGRLPEKYRTPVVLCYLEGMTYEEAGQRLGCSKGTISTRLTRARELLKSRLAGRGLAIPAVSLTAWLCANAASAGAPNSLVVATIKVATCIAAGQAASSAMISTKVAALAEDVVKAMFLTKLKIATTVLASCALVFVTGWTLWSAVRSAQPNGTSPPNAFRVAESKAPVDDNKAPDAPSKPQAEERTKLPDPIGGIVRSPDGKPLANARVTIDLFENDGPMIEFERRRRWTTTTDEKGAYGISTKDLGLLPPRWSFNIRAVAKDLPETRVLSLPVQTVAKQRKFDDVKFFAGVAVHGRILDPEGRPAKGAFLYPACLIGDREAWFPRAAVAGDDGRFRVVLPAGPDGKVVAVDMIAMSANWAPKHVFIAAGAETNLGDIRLHKGTVVEGRLIDENNRPVADALIAARGNEAGGIRNFNQWTLAARTEKDGSFRFPSPMADGIAVFAASPVHAHVGGEIEILKTKRTVMILPKTIELHREAGPTLRLALQAVPSVSVRGTIRWTNGKPASRVWVMGVVSPGGYGLGVSNPLAVSTNAEGKYELKVPKGIEGFAIMVGGREEGDFIYIAHAVGKNPGSRQAIGDKHFERLDESIDGVDWEMREHERVKEAPKAPTPKQTMAPGEAELRELDRTVVEGMNSLRKQAEKAKTDKERIGLQRLLPYNDEKVVQSLFELEKKHRANSTGLMALALVMRLAQIDVDPNSAAAKGRNQAVAILAEHYGEHEDLDLCLERLRNGSPVFCFEILCGAALKRNPHPHVRAAALLYWALLLKESAALKTGLPSLLAQLDREPGAMNALLKTWLLAIKPRVEAIDPVQANKEAALLAQRLVDEFPKVEMVGRVPEPNSFLVHRVAAAQGTYAGQAERLLFELKNLSVGQTAPDFEGRDADNRTLKLSDLRGKVVVLMFSANWCGPCKKTYPVLRELQKKYAGGRLEIVSVMADNEERTVKQAQEKNEITWRALWDGPNGPIATRWNVQAYPTLYVLDSAGVIRVRDSAAGSLSEQIDKLLAVSAK